METLTQDYVEQNVASKQSRGYKIFCPSPGCGGNDCWFTPDNGVAFCFNCGYKAKVNDAPYVRKEDAVLDIASIRHFYREVASLYVSFMTKEHKEYLYTRGFDDSLIEEFQVGYCPDDSMPYYEHQSAKIAGMVSREKKPVMANRITFPYHAEDTVVDIRGRAFPWGDPKYKSPRFSSKARGAIYPYNYDRAMKKIIDQNKNYLILTEGEIKAIIADAYGFPCVAYPGMMTYRQTPIPAGVKPIAIFDTDSDMQGRRRVDMALQNLSQQHPDLHVVLLPLHGNEKMDIDSYLLKFGSDKFQFIVDRAVTYTHYKSLRRF